MEALFDVEASETLTEAQKRRVTGRAGAVLGAVAPDELRLAHTRELAVERLVEKLREALAVPRRRIPTSPSAGARERRLSEKRRRAGVKRSRRPPTEGD